jgi:hypothetical protein
MINDYVLIRDGKIINLSFEIDVYTDKALNQGEIINNVINTVKNYLSIQKWQMGDNIYLATLIEEINNVTGVLNVTDIKVYNKVGGNYSANAISQAYVDDTTRQINLTADYALFGEFDTMFEVKFPDTDIRVRTKS